MGERSPSWGRRKVRGGVEGDRRGSQDAATACPPRRCAPALPKREGGKWKWVQGGEPGGDPGR